jgi:hypothetical protein
MSASRHWPIAALFVAATLALPTAAPAQSADTHVAGIVYEDTNGNGRRDADERGVPGVRVSNGRDVTTTDADGRYRLPISGDAVIFVVKPRNWMTPVCANNLPQFHYVHRPTGSPPLKYAGVSPTGPLPESVDFALVRRPEPDEFTALIFGDTQTRDAAEVEYVARDLVAETSGTTAAFGITLGDVVFDDLSVFDLLVPTMGRIGVPWYHVAGNHDMNYDAADDAGSLETFTRVFGPPHYAFEHGPVLFFVLDDVVWHPPQDDRRGRYTAGFGADQLAFIAGVLEGAPIDQLVVLLMHIPIWEAGDRADLARLLRDRPNVLALAAHTHTHYHRFLGENDGWPTPRPLHAVSVGTSCGGWWTGLPDEYGVPHALMPDGTPNGYLVATFGPGRYQWRWQAARRPASFQMTIHAPHALPAADVTTTQILVNVFDGSAKSTARLRLRERGDWITLDHTPLVDPGYAALHAAGQAEGAPSAARLPGPAVAQHIWSGYLPATPPGTYTLEVESRDMFGQLHTARHVLRVE